jgi:hypothetical protein
MQYYKGAQFCSNFLFSFLSNCSFTLQHPYYISIQCYWQATIIWQQNNNTLLRIFIIKVPRYLLLVSGGILILLVL